MNSVERKLLIRKLASRWYMNWHSSRMSTDTLKEYMQDLKINKITTIEEYELKLIMADLYIELLNDRIDELEDKLNSYNN